MSAIVLLKQEELPDIFKYPEEFLQIVNQGLIDFKPWIIMSGDYLHDRYQGLKERYKKSVLIPFARRLDNDDLACWNIEDLTKVFIIHDFASEGWEKRKTFNSFWEWFKQIVDDMIEHEK